MWLAVHTNIGRAIQDLKATGAFDRTFLIIFFLDLKCSLIMLHMATYGGILLMGSNHRCYNMGTSQLQMGNPKKCVAKRPYE